LPELQAIGHLIQSALFNANNGTSHGKNFEGRKLVELVATIRQSKNKEIKLALRRSQYALPPLYRT
jgi:hypothetical protein